MNTATSRWASIARGFGIAALVVGMSVPTFAADEETSAEVSSDRSTNPVTGTVTDSRQVKREKKRADGSRQDVDVTEKVKTNPDGSREATLETERSAAEPAH